MLTKKVYISETVELLIYVYYSFFA